jgi:hypothetical protein
LDRLGSLERGESAAADIVEADIVEALARFTIEGTGPWACV